MARGWTSFVVLAGMRTGSNALEERLNDYKGIVCHGEVFNPHFIGHAGCETLFGKSLAERDADPAAMIATLQRGTDGLAGFRLFDDHDPRVLEMCLSDRRCAKIVLTRNPAESYVSLKIARATGQWWLSDLANAKPGRATFNAEEFEAYMAARAAYLEQIRRRLQTTGQTAFHISQAEVNDEEVIAGAARFLGAKEKHELPTRKGKVQNPKPLSEKVTNFAEMQAALAERDVLGLEERPEYEPARGPNIPAYVASRALPLLYMPVKCAADTEVQAWIAALDGVAPEAVQTALTQKKLRQWKRRNATHRSFTVVAHPVERAHAAFCRFILPAEPPAFTGIRQVLVRTYGVPLPDDPADPAYDAAAHGRAFLAFLKFVKGNLAGQTSVRVDSAWASQSAILSGMAEFMVPDAVLRAGEIDEDLPRLAERLGAERAPEVPEPPDGRHALADIYSDAIERAAREAYQRDYMMFGFRAWRMDPEG